MHIQPALVQVGIDGFTSCFDVTCLECLRHGIAVLLIGRGATHLGLDGAVHFIPSATLVE